MNINCSSAWLRLRSAFAAKLLPLALLAALACPAQAQFNYATLNGTITITGYSGPDGAVVIPDTIDGVPVARIGDNAFRERRNITSVTIPEGVTSIGHYAFYFCTSLTTVVIPNTVTSIGHFAFTYCQLLTSVTIPNGVTSIGHLAFFHCNSLASVTIPDSTTSIGIFAFYYCTSLTNVTIPYGVTSIGDSAFLRCTNLRSITVDALNPDYCSVEGVLFNKSQTLLLQCPGAKAGSFAIPGTVTSIGNHAFDSCASVSIDAIPIGVTSIGEWAFYACASVTIDAIPSTVTSIGKLAFQSCASLPSLTIPDSVTSIGDQAFASCPSLCAITVDPLNAAYSSVDGVLFNKNQTLLIQCPGGKAGSYAIPDGVGSIGQYAFYYCISLTNVTIPTSVASIGTYAFFICTSLTTITIPSSVTSIEDFAFESCGNLSAITVDALNPVYSSVEGALYNKNRTLLILCPQGKTGSYTIPSGVTIISGRAFESCARLTSVTIPSSVTFIGDAAFSDCATLTELFFHGNPPGIGTVFGLGAYNATLYYLPGATGWGTTFAGRPTALWNPLIETTDASFGVRTNRFGFTITWAGDLVTVVEACTNLTNPTWFPIGTNTLTGGSSYFSDPEWTNHPVRFYRLRSP